MLYGRVDGTDLISGLLKLQKLVMSETVGAARSVDVSPDGELIAIGLKNGGFVVLNVANFKVLAQNRDRGQMINDIRSDIYMALTIYTVVLLKEIYIFSSGKYINLPIHGNYAYLFPDSVQITGTWQWGPRRDQ